MSNDVDFSVSPEVDAIANFKHDNRALVGHLVSLSIGGETLATDFNFVDPMNPTSRVPICGMITFLQWNKKPGGVLLLEGRISDANQGMFQDAVDSREKTAICEFKLNIYKYDYATKAYYKYFHTDDQVIKGQLSEEHTSTVYDELAQEYKQIANHRFVLAITGTDEEDPILHIAYSPDRKKTFPFGQKCG